MIGSERGLRTLPEGEHADPIVPGLVLRVRGNTRAWCVRARGKRTTIGRFPIMGLADAREAARGVLLAKPGEAAPTTLEAAVELYAADMKKRGARSAFKREGTIRLHILPGLAARDVKSLTRRELQAIVDRVEAAGTPAQAGQIAGMTRTLFAWLLKRGYLDADPTAGGLVRPPSKPRERSLTDAEIKAVWAACNDEPHGRLVKLLLLTACRREEMTQLRRAEVHADRIVLPAARTKQGRQHVVPLLPMAAELIVGAVSAHAELVFQGHRGSRFRGWSHAMKVLHRDSKTNGWTPHDLRRTAARIMLQEGVLPHTVEAALGHAKETQLMRTYHVGHDAFPEKHEALLKLQDSIARILKAN